MQRVFTQRVAGAADDHLIPYVAEYTVKYSRLSVGAVVLNSAARRHRISGLWRRD